MPLLALLVTIPLGDILSKLPKEKQQVPQEYTESTRLPGNPPASAKSLLGAWQMDYSEDDVQVGRQLRIVSLCDQSWMEIVLCIID